MPAYVEHRLKFTYEDLLAIPEDDPYRHEILDGMHVASPSPVYRHQTVSRRIQHQLFAQIEAKGAGEVVDAPMDVELGTYDIVEPDIFVVLAGNPRVKIDTIVHGTPDLIVEILSPSTAERDRTIKLERYEESGVPEYWIVDPETENVAVYRYDGAAGRYAAPEFYRERLRYRSGEIDAEVDLLEVWRQ